MTCSTTSWPILQHQHLVFASGEPFGTTKVRAVDPKSGYHFMSPKSQFM
jgi:hypothetical protein